MSQRAVSSLSQPRVDVLDGADARHVNRALTSSHPRELRQRIVPQMGRCSSAVLGLDLAVSGGKLQFFYGMAELFGSADLIDRLQGMMSELETRAEQAQARPSRPRWA
ncbi:hypothetical protein BE21_45310 [Sorangium cellulosum]|uniref:Uncharacterized protein n=1 Tax=Sorangium cellulosum TaxID=56 RepID=A0A150TJN8_SORCE|nr:hypothetical protein BE21_45310 [Sorangium cellulosum]